MQLDLMMDEYQRGVFGRSGPTIPGLVRLDRAILYIKQRIFNLIQMIEAKDTKGLGDTYYAVLELMRQMASLLAMGGHENLAGRMVLIARKLSTRTPRKHGIGTLRDFLAELEGYAGEQDGEDVQGLREGLNMLGQQFGDGQDEKPTRVDISKENTVFVIMPLKPEFNDVWKGGILRAAKAASFTPIRVDMINRSTNITDDIVESVGKCRLVIVDVTGNNPNVMFELGYAVARTKPHIIISQSVDYLPFDIRNIRAIVYANTWSGIEELSEKVQEFLREHSTGSKKSQKRKASTAV